MTIEFIFQSTIQRFTTYTLKRGRWSLVRPLLKEFAKEVEKESLEIGLLEVVGSNMKH